jgi:hypothetical protein
MLVSRRKKMPIHADSCAGIQKDAHESGQMGIHLARKEHGHEGSKEDI